MIKFVERVLAAMAVALTAAPLHAQCQGQWSSMTTGIPGGATIRAIHEMPAGNVVIGGWFSSVSGVAANNVAVWDGSAWSNMGAGTNEMVVALDAFPSGDVLAGGWFTAAEGATANRLARWSAADRQWTAFGNFSGIVRAVKVLPDQRVLVGGEFCGSAPGLLQIGLWTGAAWVPIRGATVPPNYGTGCAGAVYALKPLPSGEVVAGGGFSYIAGTSANLVARWSGVASTNWVPYAAIPSSAGHRVRAIEQLQNGDIVIGGTFPGGVARWNGSAWVSLAVNLSVTALKVMPNGDLIAAGQGNSVVAGPLARWDGTSWFNMGLSQFSEVWSLALLSNGDLLAGGTFTVPGVVGENLFRWTPPGPRRVVIDPASAVACSRESVFYEADSLGAGPLTYQWQCEDGAGGWQAIGQDGVALACGAMVTVTSADSASTHVSIRPCPATGGIQQFRLRCLVSNACGGLSSNVVTHSICAADFSCSNGVTIDDLFLYINAYFTGAPAADFNGVGGVTIDDLFLYINAYFVGC